MTTLVSTELEMAYEIDRKVRHIAGRMTKDFLALGDLMLQMEPLWRHLVDDEGKPYSSYESWVRSAIPRSRSLAFKARQIVSQLGTVPRDQLEQVSRDNMEILRRVPEAKRTPEIIEAAVSLPHTEFATALQVAVPEALIEARKRLVFALDLSQAQVIEETLEWAAIELGDPGDPPLGRDECLELILVEWRQFREGGGENEGEGTQI